MSAGIHFRDARAPAGMRLYAIGDVHGRLDLLSALHELIRSDLERDRPDDWRVIHLGDYIDRGPDSKGVIDLLIEAQGRDSRFMCLGGNHDAGLIDFLAAPSTDSLFIRYGGVETARSYGVVYAGADGLRPFHAALGGAVPDAHLSFLRSRPLSAGFGDFFFCHAGVRPSVRLDQQEPEDLIWIRRGFLDYEGLLEKVVVHGHTISDEPEILPFRVNVDTGAYHSGRLTALRIDGQSKEFLTAVA